MSTILAVDDAQDTLMLLEFDLQSEGYDVITANDGETALRLLKENHIDLMLLDLYMPGLSGLETLERLKKESAFVNTPVIMLSASDDEDEIVSALELGANDYITKPYIPKVLLARLKTSLRLLEKTQELERLARTDFLTGVNNKGSYEQLTHGVLEQMSRTNENAAIAMLDIDYFKAINDQYGHGVGDDVLKLFSKTMQSEFRPYDVLGRVGGEEFAVCMPNTDLEGAYAACERFREVISQLSMETHNGVIEFTVSIGLASMNYNQQKTGFEELMNTADNFLYQAKELSRNCTRTYDVIHATPSVEKQTNLADNQQQTQNEEEMINGIDMSIGMGNVLGDESLYKEILQMFCDDHQTDDEKIQLAISNQDQASIKHLVHTLKGVACSIGAMQLFENAKKLDEAVSEENTGNYQSLFDDVAFELRRVVDGISAYLT